MSKPAEPHSTATRPPVYRPAPSSEEKGGDEGQTDGVFFAEAGRYRL